MDRLRRKTYLKALGIEAWVPRSQGSTAAALGASPAAQTPVADAVAIPAAPRAATSAAAPTERARTRNPLPREPAPLVDAAATATAAASEPIDLPQDWDGLRAMVKDCRRCKLCQTRTQTVFGVGPRDAPLMIVGEAPGADEDAQGEPFVGRAGKLLDEMLAAIGRSRRSQTAAQGVFIANVVKCRPPGNRDPEPDEVEACRPYLEQQLRMINPRLIVGFGKVAAQRFLGSNEPLSRLRAETHAYGPQRTPLFITYHPAYLLRSPREKAKSWEDLKRIWRFLKGQG